MTKLSPEQRAALDRAKGRVAENAIVFHRTYMDEPFEFKFLPAMNQQALAIVSQVQSLSAENSEATLPRQLDLLLEFMDVIALESTAELIGELGRCGIMKIGDLVDLQMEVVQAVGGRPTTRSSSSADGSPNSGPSSTASPQPQESTPLPSPSTGS